MASTTVTQIRHGGAAGPVASAFRVGVREIRTVWRTPAAFLPGLFIPIFFYFIQVGALSGFAKAAGLSNYKAFQLPVSILFAVSNGGAGLNMVTDIETGYFDKLLLTPAPRFALLIGSMAADFSRVFFQGLLVAFVALLAGLDFATGAVGAFAMVVIASLWGLAYSAIGYAIALKTGNSQATQSAFVFFFPLMFLTTSFAPKEALSGWLQTAATYNPITYLLDAMRSLSMVGWDPEALLKGLLAIGAVGVVTVSLALLAMRGRVR